jgi:hypothetical protein
MNSPFLSAALAEAHRAELLRSAAEYRRAHQLPPYGSAKEPRRKRAVSLGIVPPPRINSALRLISVGFTAVATLVSSRQSPPWPEVTSCSRERG